MAASSSARVGGCPSGQREASQPWPRSTRSSGRAAAKSRTRARAASRVGAPDRSRPVRARPVEVVCTCASVNAGVTRAPSRSITSSTPSAKASAAPSEPTQATWPRSTTIAVAKGSAGLWTSPRRSRTVVDGVVVSLMVTSLAPRGARPARRSPRYGAGAPRPGRRRRGTRPVRRPSDPGPVGPGAVRPEAAGPRTAWTAPRWSGSRHRPGSAPGRGGSPARAGSTRAP